ncbi:hypothetical protein D3C76_1529260 [compost metagenome]
MFQVIDKSFEESCRFLLQMILMPRCFGISEQRRVVPNEQYKPEPIQVGIERVALVQDDINVVGQ